MGGGQSPLGFFHSSAVGRTDHHDSSSCVHRRRSETLTFRSTDTGDRVIPALCQLGFHS